MKYQAYAEYKASEIEMLGRIPTDWQTKQVRYLLKDGAEGIKIGPFGSALKLEDMVDSGFRVYGQENVIKKNFTLGKRKISKSKFEEMKVYQIYTNDLLITMMGTSGKCELVPDDAEIGIIDSHLLRMRVKEYEIVPKYFRLLIDECYEIENQIKISGKGSIMHGLNSSIVKALSLPLPSIVEQNAILSFLDHETAKIDTLIEKQQQLIKLLKEKRQAVISHAVTKGLNPKAPMRDSGVEWLGEVPEHWGIRRINLLFTESSVRASAEVELDYPVLSVSIHHGISDKELNSEELDRKVQRSEDKSLYKVVHENYLAYNMMRAWQGGFGASTLSGLVSPAYVVCKPRTLLDSFYFELVLRTLNAVIELKRYSRGITDFRLRLYWDEFRNICVPVPPSDEIDEILKSISKINSTYDNLAIVAERQIKLLKERRTALISAAVTGKTDVRNWQAPNSESKAVSA